MDKNNFGKGSSKQTGNISDAALARATGIPKPTLISWRKTDFTNWRYRHYWFLKSMTKEEIEEILKKSKEIEK